MPTDTTEQEWTVVFAGPGLVTPETVQVNLDRFLPKRKEGEGGQDVAAVVLPTRIPRDYKGLRVVEKWLTSKDNFGPNGVDRYDNLADFINSPPKDLAETQLYLVILWGEEGDDAAEKLVRLATDLGIPVKDLTASMDDVVFEDKPPAEPEPEATPRRTRRTRGASADNIVPPKAEPVTPPAVSEKPAGRRRGSPRATNVTSPTVTLATSEDVEPTSPPWEPGGVQAIVDHATKAGVDAATAAAPELHASAHQVPSTMLELVAELETFIEAKVAELFIDFGKSLVAKSPGRPRKDGSPAQARTEPEKVALVMLGDGTYVRRGVGKPSANQKVVFVDPEEVDDYLDRTAAT